MTGQFDIHATAIAAVGAAAVEDPRITTHDKHLIGSIAAALKHYMLRVDAMEATLAVRSFYRQAAATGDPLTAEGLVHVIRRTRLEDLRNQQQRKDDFQSAQKRDEMLEDWDAIRSWDCPDCGAPAGVWCTNSVTKEPMGPCPGHPKRIVLAQRGDAA